MGKEKIIGIDLGTSNSEAAVMLGGKPTIIPSAEGATVAGKMFPSYVAFTADGQLLVGEPARRQAVSNPDGTVTAAKRKMGTSHSYRIYGKEYTPQQISAFLLQKIKRDAEAFLGETVTKAVITVPAYFNDNQRTATKDAGKIAGLDVVRLVNEPTAASMAYGLDRGGEYKILVFDLGGGTLDVTIMEFGGGTFTVLATSGDTQLGGTDMDNAVFEWVAGEFKKLEGIDLRSDKMAVNRVKEAAEKAKIELSTVHRDRDQPPVRFCNPGGPETPFHKAEPLKARTTRGTYHTAVPQPLRTGPEGRRTHQGRYPESHPCRGAYEDAYRPEIHRGPYRKESRAGDRSHGMCCYRCGHPGGYSRGGDHRYGPPGCDAPDPRP